MNEKICKPYKKGVSCFEDIPQRLEMNGNNNNYCSITFPPGYAIFVEKFMLDTPDSDNFVLLDGKPLDYKPELKWIDRQQQFRETLPKENPLRNKNLINRRNNYPCVKSLKASDLTFTKLMFYTFIPTGSGRIIESVLV